MSNDQITTTRTESYGSRLKGALMGILVGPVLVFSAATVLWTNEGRNANMISGFEEGKKIVREVTSEKIDPENEGALIHLSGNATTDTVLNDRDFALALTGIKLERRVEMYQWQEKSDSQTTDNYGGSATTTTTYTYSKEWTSEKIDSSRFHEPLGHENPANWKYLSQSFVAEKVNIGPYLLSTPLIARIDASVGLDIARYTPEIHTGETLIGSIIYVGKDPNTPAIGDMRISYVIAPDGMTLSLLAKQVGNSLGSYIARSGAEITRVDSGMKTAVEMFEKAEAENTFITWLIRMAGLLFIYIGFSLFFRIIPMLAKVIPPLAWVVGAGVGLVAFLLTVIIGGGVIMIAWFAYRPLLSGVILVIIIGLVSWGYTRIRKNKETLSSDSISPGV